MLDPDDIGHNLTAWLMYEEWAHTPECLLLAQLGSNTSASGAMANTTMTDTLTRCYFSGSNPNSEEYDVLRSQAFTIPVIILYAIIIVVGAIGNMLVVLTVIRTKQLWTATNIFIANLAVSDVFVCVFDLPFSAYYQITEHWAFGNALCHVMTAGFGVVAYVSTLTLTLIAIDRYILIVYPLKVRMSVNMALMLVVAIALLAIGVASPIGIYSKYIIYDDAAINVFRRLCIEQWPSRELRQIYGLVTAVLQYFLPLMVIAILYFCIFRRVRSRMGQRRRRQSRTIKMLVSVVTVFALCWTPWHIFTLIAEIDYSAVQGRYYRFTDILLRAIAMSSSCMNPFLYAWFNENYRTAFLSLIRKPTVAPSGIREETLEQSKSVTLSNRLNGYSGHTASDEKLPLQDTKL